MDRDARADENATLRDGAATAAAAAGRPTHLEQEEDERERRALADDFAPGLEHPAIAPPWSSDAVSNDASPRSASRSSAGVCPFSSLCASPSSSASQGGSGSGAIGPFMTGKLPRRATHRGSPGRFSSRNSPVPITALVPEDPPPPPDHKTLLEAITECQRQFIAGQNVFVVFEKMLDHMLQLTGSGYGFIATAERDENDQVEFLRSMAITNISWDQASQEFYDAYFRKGMEFRSKDFLPYLCVEEDSWVISNDPASDPRRGGPTRNGVSKLPDGHPPLRSYLGLPLYSENRIVGVAGMANRLGGYDESVVEFLEPFCVFCANLIQSMMYKMKGKALEERTAQFYANISHELRTPLQGIIGVTELAAEEEIAVLESSKDEREHRSAQRHLEHTNIVLAASNVLLSIVNNVLDFTKIEFNRMDVNIKDVELTSLLDVATQCVSIAANAQGVSLTVQVAENVPHAFRVDPYLVQRVLINLMSNAVKFTPEGGRVTLSVMVETIPKGADPTPLARLAAHADIVSMSSPLMQIPMRYCADQDKETAGDAAEYRLIVVVEDTGIGISEEGQRRLFKPFSQVHAEESSRTFGGTGLGLFTCQTIAKLVGGDLEVHSELDKGSSFTFACPLQVVKDATESSAVLSNVSIVLADMREEVASHMTWVCRRAGCTRLRTVGTFAEAAALAAEHNKAKTAVDSSTPAAADADDAAAEVSMVVVLGAETSVRHQEIAELKSLCSVVCIMSNTFQAHESAGRSAVLSMTTVLLSPITFNGAVKAVLKSLEQRIEAMYGLSVGSSTDFIAERVLPASDISSSDGGWISSAHHLNVSPCLSPGPSTSTDPNEGGVDVDTDVLTMFNSSEAQRRERHVLNIAQANHATLNAMPFGVHHSASGSILEAAVVIFARRRDEANGCWTAVSHGTDGAPSRPCSAPLPDAHPAASKSGTQEQQPERVAVSPKEEEEDDTRNLLPVVHAKAHKGRNKPKTESRHLTKSEIQLAQDKRRFGHLCVLFVDDNSINRRVVVRQLQRLQVGTIHTANDGMEALEFIQNSTAGRDDVIVFMDIQMPVMNGLESAKAIRKYWQETHPEDAVRPFIVGQSASMDDASSRECKAAGMDSTLCKPISLDMIRTCLAEAPFANEI